MEIYLLNTGSTTHLFIPPGWNLPYYAPRKRSLTLLENTPQVQRIRESMVATTTHVYLNTGTFGPLPYCVIQAMQERMQSE